MLSDPSIEPNPVRLSIEEIERRYPNQWVVIIDYEFEPARTELTTGVVYAHGPSREALRPIARGFRHRALRWTGEIKNTGQYFRGRRNVDSAV